MALLEVVSLTKRFGATTALRDVSLAVEPGQIIALLGPSGCGKTTLLRIVAGLDRPDAGSVRFEGRDLDGVPPHRRDFGLMFQDLALFPHLDVAANVAFGLRMRRWPRSRIDDRVRGLLDDVGLAGFGGRSIEELSGGEAQRVALARSLAPAPRLLMLDEPLGALDRALRESLMVELRQVLKSVGVTALYVTHDQEEALAVADRVAVLVDGRLAQVATPAELIDRPASAFVARFLGYRNLLAARVDRSRDGLVIRTPIGAFVMPEGRESGERQATLLVPEDAVTLIDEAPATLGPNEFAGEIVGRVLRGRRARLQVRVGDGEIGLSVEASRRLLPGDTARFSIDPAALRLLPPEREAAGAGQEGSDSSSPSGS